MSATYNATFSMERWHGVPNNWVECDGIRFESNIALPIIRIICEALKNAGKPDGSIAFFEDGYIEPTHVFPSIYEIVDRMNAPASKRANPNAPVITDAIYQALQQLADDPAHWNNLHGRIRSSLLDRNYVSVDGAVPTITELGQAAREAHVVKAPKPPKAEATPVADYPSDLSKASKDALVEAASQIGLKSEQNLARTLSFIEMKAAKYSVQELEEMAWKVKVKVGLTRCKTDLMKKRRLLAAIANAGKLAEAL